MVNKQFLFTNEALYERNISDRIWPMFLQAQIENNLTQAHIAVKSYFLFTQQWYPKRSAEIKGFLDKTVLPRGKAITVSRALENDKLRVAAWNKLEFIWMQISNELEKYGLFKKQFTIDNNQLALPTR